MTLALALASSLPLLSGCSNQESTLKMTWEEYEEVESHLGSGGEANSRFFSSTRGRELLGKRLREVFSDRGIASLGGASRVEAFRIVDTAWHPRPQDPIGEMEGYPITSIGQAQGSDFASGMATYLLDGKLYFYHPDCIDDPGVAFRLWKGKESVTLLVCYQCEYLEVIVRDGSGRPIHRAGTFFRDFSGAPDLMRRLAKEAFPDDREIQAL
jgi:hypothetical protein